MYQRILLTLASGAAILGTWGVLIPSAGGVENAKLSRLPGVSILDVSLPNKLPAVLEEAKIVSSDLPKPLVPDTAVGERHGIRPADRMPAAWFTGNAGP